MAPWTLPARQPDPRQPDPLTTVIGLHGSTYSCPDLPTLDGHLAALCSRLRHASPHFPALVLVFRAEIDRLLERRRWLEMAAEVGGPEVGGPEVGGPEVGGTEDESGPGVDAPGIGRAA